MRKIFIIMQHVNEILDKKMDELNCFIFGLLLALLLLVPDHLTELSVVRDEYFSEKNVF